MKVLNHLVITLCALCISFNALAVNIEVSKQYVRETIPGTKISSAYMTINNQQTDSIKLIGVSSKVSDRIELHEHSMADGMMKMRQVESIIIKANDDVVLQPHGYHIMIFNLDTPLQAGKTAEMTLEFSNGDKHSILVPIKGIKQLEHHH